MNTHKKHEIGEIFGTKKIISIEKDKNNKTIYILECKCKEITKYIVYNLIKNSKCQKCNVNKKIGTKNHKCTFLKYIGNKNYECLCDCGNVYLARDRSKSCGCHIEEEHIKDAKKLEGIKFNAIKIISFSHFELKKNGSKISLYNAKCKCGKLFRIKRSRIFRNKTCGCRILNNHAKGERQGNNKYSEQDIINIKNLYFTCSYSTQDLSNIFNIPKYYINSLVSNKGWKHITANNQLLINNPLSIILKPKEKVEIGIKYGKWTVLNKVSSKHKRTYYLCQCECGNTNEVPGSSLIRGLSTKCFSCNSKNFSDLNRSKIS
jgi:hypothetical protein